MESCLIIHYWRYRHCCKPCPQWFVHCVYVAHMKESCLIIYYWRHRQCCKPCPQWSVHHVNVARMNESRLTYEGVMSHHLLLKTQAVLQALSPIVGASCKCRTYQRVTSNIWRSHVSLSITEDAGSIASPVPIGSCMYMTCIWVMRHVWTSHDSHIKESCLTYEWVVSPTRMSYVSHMHGSCLTYEWGMAQMCSVASPVPDRLCMYMSHVSHTKESCV